MRALVAAVIGASIVALGACTGLPSMESAVGELSLEVTSPSAGAELDGTEGMIEVKGTATSTSRSEILSVWINGTEAEVSEGEFSVIVSAAPGVNHIAVEASDGYLVATRELDVLYAAQYMPPVDDTASYEVPNALELRLGQLFFDVRRHGSELDLAADPVVATDLAAALELVLHHVDLEALLPDGLQFGSGDALLDVDIGTVVPNAIVVDARIINTPAQALELNIDLLGVTLPMNGDFTFQNNTMTVAGGITVDMHATATLTLGVDLDDTIAVDATAVSARVGPLVPAFTGPDGDELNALITIGESDFRIVVEGLISQQLIPTFTDSIPPLLETLLGAVGGILADTSFELDAQLGGEPVQVTLNSYVSGLDVVPGAAIGTDPGHVTVRQHVSIGAPGMPIHSDSRGAAQVVLPVRPLAPATGVGLAMRLDFLNSLTHALWNRGLLEGSAMASGLAATVSAKLPPVVRATPIMSSCRIDGEACDITLQIGQLEVGLTDFGQVFGVNATAGARVIVEGDKISLKLQEVPVLTVWEISNEGDQLLSPDAVRDIIERVVWPELFGALGENLSFALPALPDLSTLGLDAYAPGLANAELELVVRPRPEVESGYVTIGADVRLVTPPP